MGDRLRSADDVLASYETSVEAERHAAHLLAVATKRSGARATVAA
jgi:hypothetical protein